MIFFFISDDRYSNVAPDVMYNIVDRGLQKHRRLGMPLNPRNVSHFIDLLEEPNNITKYGCTTSGRFYVKSVECGDSKHCIFVNSTVLDVVYETGTISSNIDCTFSTCPSIFKQILIILVIKNGRVSYFLLHFTAVL